MADFGGIFSADGIPEQGHVHCLRRIDQLWMFPYFMLGMTYPILAHDIGEALGATRAGDEPDLDLWVPELCGARRHDHVTLLGRISN